MRLTFDDAGGLANAAHVMEVESLAAGARASAGVRHFGFLLKTRIQANASGRPGPRAPTGDYRRSWGVELGFSGPGESNIGLPGLSPWAEVGTNKPQGRRLELGFVGTDSLGRSYDQPAYEHVGPAFDRTAPEFEAYVGGMTSL